MLLFGHIGITLGVALSGNQIYNTRLKSRVKPSKEQESGIQSKPNSESVKGMFDVRFWLLGSILPDVIDKPIGHYLFRQAFYNNGYLFSHTLLFFILLLGAGLCIGIAKKRMWLLALSFGVFIHLVLDSMWEKPKTLFWPVFGYSFPRSGDYDFLWSIFQEFFHYPSDYIPELIGISIVGWIIWKLIRNKQVVSFLRKGYF